MNSQADLEELKETIAACYPHVYNQCRRMVGGDRNGADLAQDLAQGAMLKAISHAHQYGGRASVSSWVYRIAHNHVLDEWNPKRKNARKNLCTSYIDDLLSIDGQTPEALKINHTNERWINRRLAYEALSLLSPRERKIVLLLYRGWECRKISAILNVPEGTLKVWIYRLRRRIRERMQF